MNKIKLYLLTLFAMLSVSAIAQETEVKGTVVDDFGEPIVGAYISVDGTKNITITDSNGNYTINAPADGTITINFIGMKTQTVSVDGRSVVDVSMEYDMSELMDIVVVGYGTQKRGSLTGAISAVKGDEMVRTKNANPQNMLTGRLAGVRVWQKSAEPGAFNNAFDIRGMGTPLVVIDGVPRDMADFQRMNANDIKDISVLKDASAAIYGLRSANGVILVTTKRGEAGETKVQYHGSYTIQKPMSMPALLDAYKTMDLYNEQAKNNVNGGSAVYSEEEYEKFRNGTRRETNWNDLIFAKTSPETNHNITISGGNETVQYFLSGGYLYQEGFFKSGDLNYRKYNLTSNTTVEAFTGMNVSVNISAMTDEQKNPYSTSTDIIRNYWRQGVLFPAYADDANTMLNYEGLDLEENTVAKMTSDVSGYRNYKKTQFLTSATFEYDFGKLYEPLAGLTAKLMLSYDYHRNNNSIFRKEYYLYAYDAENNTYIQKVYGESSPSRLRREHYDNKQRLRQFTLNYDRKIYEHNVTVVIGAESQRKEGDNFSAQRDLAFASPYLFNGVAEGQIGESSPGGVYEVNYNAYIGRLSYKYAERYMVEGQFRYDGSSKFASGHRWGFFPSVSAGWNVSEESWFKNSRVNFFDQVKVRASYGEMGDDSGAGYEWLTGYKYPDEGPSADRGYYNGYAPGYVIDGAFIYAAKPLAIPNEEISWFKAKTFNVGIDIDVWNGLIGASVDYFNRKKTGLYERSIAEFPTVVGATAPLENANSSRNFGLEVELRHHNTIGKDFAYNVKAIATITREKFLTAVQNGPYANAYDEWRHDNLNNRLQGIQFGYEGNGRYNNWDEIWNETLYHDRDVLPGDYKYEDWNGDGEINYLDEHPFAYDQTPWMNYSLGFDCTWRNVDFSMLWQGSALGSMSYEEPLYRIWGSNGGGALEQYWDRWHPVDPNADPYDPNTEWESGYYAYTGRYPFANSDFNRVSTAYLRLKQIELGYTIPKWELLPNVKARVYANAYNLLTITNVKFVDPEHPSDDLGRLYPLNRTFTFGLQLSF